MLFVELCLALIDDFTICIFMLFVELCLALIDAANDKQSEVRRMIMTSLHELGKKQPEMVLSAIKAYLVKHQKVCICACLLIIKINDDHYVNTLFVQITVAGFFSNTQMLEFETELMIVCLVTWQ